MNININKQFTEENIFGNPYNYSLNEMITVMGEERAKSFFKTLYKAPPKSQNQTIKIKDIYSGGDTRKYVFQLKDNYCIETVCIKRKTGTTVCVSTMVGCQLAVYFANLEVMVSLEI